MTDTPPEELPPRLQEFQTEVDNLRISGGGANPATVARPPPPRAGEG